jgi:hypothetical protein
MAGAMLVFDLKHPVANPSDSAGQIGQWYTRELPAAPVDARMHAGRIHWLDSDGLVHYAVDDQWFDSIEGDGEEEILQSYKFAIVAASQLQNALRLYRVLIDGKHVGDCIMLVTAYIAEENRGEAITWSEAVPMTAADVDAIHADTTTTFASFTQPNTPRVLTVTFDALWNKGDVTITGTDGNGDVVSEVFGSSPGNTVTGSQVFATVSAASKATSGTAAGPASIGTPATERNEEFDFNPDPSRAATIELWITEVAAGLKTEGWRLRSIAFEIGTAGRMRKLAGTQKIGD